MLETYSDRLFQKGVGVILAFKKTLKPAAVGRRVAQLEFCQSFVGQASAFYVLKGGLPLLVLRQEKMKGACDAVVDFADLVQVLVLLLRNVGAAFISHLDAVFFRKLLNRLWIGKLFHLHRELYDVAADAAAKAMVELFYRVNGERRRLFVVKGTAAPILRAALGKVCVSVYDRDDVGRLSDALDCLLGDSAGHQRAALFVLNIAPCWTCSDKVFVKTCRPAASSIS